MKKLFSTLAAMAALTVFSACDSTAYEGNAANTPVVGQPAPGFVLKDANGKNVSLADFRGRTVVLEWHNPGCPFVQKHYGSGNMQKTQRAAMQDGVAWLSINSGAPGKQGHMDGEEALEVLAENDAAPTAYLLDPTGAVGRSYDAKTTPHMFIVDKDGTLVYAGGIDDKPTANPADIQGARNHVLAALAEVKAGKPVSVPTSRPYGCSVKY